MTLTVHVHGQETIYVSASGSDSAGTGSLTSPFATIGAALAAAKDHDIIAAVGGLHVREEIDLNDLGLANLTIMGVGRRIVFDAFDEVAPQTWAQCNKVTAAAVAAGGSGYAVNDVIEVSGSGTGLPARFTVTAVSSGSVTAASVLYHGLYSSNPATPAATTAISGGGSGCTLNLTLGASSVYRGPITHIFGGVGSKEGALRFSAQMLEDGRQLANYGVTTPTVYFEKGSKAEISSAIELDPGSFYVEGLNGGDYYNGWEAGEQTYYVHCFDGASPNSHIMHVAQREQPTFRNDNGVTKVSNVIILGGIHRDGVRLGFCEVENLDIIYPSGHGTICPGINARNLRLLYGNPALGTNGIHFFNSAENKFADECRIDGLTVVGYDAPGSTAFGCHGSSSPDDLKSVTIAAGGSGYAVGDTLTAAGGTLAALEGRASTLVVTAVSGGAITGVRITDVGRYSVAPSSPNSPTTGGAGTGASLNLTFDDAFVVGNIVIKNAKIMDCHSLGGGSEIERGYSFENLVVRNVGAWPVHEHDLVVTNASIELTGTDGAGMLRPPIGRKSHFINSEIVVATTLFDTADEFGAVRFDHCNIVSGYDGTNFRAATVAEHGGITLHQTMWKVDGFNHYALTPFNVSAGTDPIVVTESLIDGVSMPSHASIDLHTVHCDSRMQRGALPGPVIDYHPDSPGPFLGEASLDVTSSQTADTNRESVILTSRAIWEYDGFALRKRWDIPSGVVPRKLKFVGKTASGNRWYVLACDDGVLYRSQDLITWTLIDSGGRTTDWRGIVTDESGLCLLGGSAAELTALAVTGQRNHLTAATIAAGGTGYTALDIVTVAGGTGQVASTVRIDTVGGSGEATAVTIIESGLYTADPSTPNSPTGGTGTGLSLNLTYAALATDKLVDLVHGVSYSGPLTCGHSDGTTWVVAGGDGTETSAGTDGTIMTAANTNLNTWTERSSGSNASYTIAIHVVNTIWIAVTSRFSFITAPSATSSWTNRNATTVEPIVLARASAADTLMDRLFLFGTTASRMGRARAVVYDVSGTDPASWTSREIAVPGGGVAAATFNQYMLKPNPVSSGFSRMIVAAATAFQVLYSQDGRDWEVVAPTKGKALTTRPTKKPVVAPMILSYLMAD